MIKYGMVPLSKNLERAKANETTAIDQHLRRIKLNGLRWLRQAVKESKAEE